MRVATHVPPASSSRFAERSTVALVTLAICDDLDIAAEARVAERVREALSLQPSHLVMDVSGCGFIDATGVGVLLEAHRAARRAESELIIRGASDAVLRVLDLCGLEGVFHLEPARTGT